MKKILFSMTDDNSAGLYDEEINDIYHSKTGALKEAIDKFIIPSQLSNLVKLKDEINILDICYGIGYNSKAAFISKEKANLNIDCLDINPMLIFISPFIKDNIDDFDLKIYLFSEILKNCRESSEFYVKNFSTVYLKDVQFFEPSMINFIKFLITEGYIYSGSSLNLSFLHNIYYKYISTDMKNSKKANKYSNSKINFKIGDARNTLKELDSLYDVIFLDAFSPQKAPELWTINFINLIKNKMHNNSVLLSYSKSTPFRSALLELGFFVGKTLINEIDMGTVASMNKNYILNTLSDYDLALINTRAGIFYEDSDFTLSSADIIKNRLIKISRSDKISHTSFLKSSKIL